MFGLFKRKKKIETPETVDTPVVEETANEQTPDETVIEHIESETQQTPVIEETRQPETMTENFRQPEKIHIPDIESFR